MLSGGQKTATGAAGALVAILLISLCFAPNRTMVCLNLCYAVVTSIFIYLEWMVFTPILNFVVLFYGAFVGIHAIFDTYQDTIRRTVLRSDGESSYVSEHIIFALLVISSTCSITMFYFRISAYACYDEVCPCCLPKCVGIQWAMCNIVLQLAGIWIAMVQLSDECENMGWWDCIAGDGQWGGDGNLWDWEERAAHNIEEWLHW